MAPVPPGAPYGVYIHIPFCAHICPYCDFNTYAGQDALIPSYVEALKRELFASAPAVAGRNAGTIFFGGGTPSLLSPEQVGTLVQAVRDDTDLDPGAEITLEANPNSVDEAWFEGILSAGVNRLSLGVQTTQRRGLRVLGRQHEAEDALHAVRAARSAGFSNVSLDLIFGWPGQHLDDWRADLERVLEWDDAIAHLSLYSLIIEPGTPMADAVKRGILIALDDDATADMYETAITVMAEAGWNHYEVANWARSSPEDRPGALPGNASRHNALYWRNGDYLGIGAGSHGHLAGLRTMNHLSPRTYIDALFAGHSAHSNVEEIDERTQMGETMMVGLRLLGEGVADADFLARHGASLDAVYGDVITRLTGLGLLERAADRVRLTHRGLMLANDVCSEFL